MKRGGQKVIPDPAGGDVSKSFFTSTKIRNSPQILTSVAALQPVKNAYYKPVFLHNNVLGVSGGMITVENLYTTMGWDWKGTDHTILGNRIVLKYIKDDGTEGQITFNQKGTERHDFGQAVLHP